MNSPSCRCLRGPGACGTEGCSVLLNGACQTPYPAPLCTGEKVTVQWPRILMSALRGSIPDNAAHQLAMCALHRVRACTVRVRPNALECTVDCHGHTRHRAVTTGEAVHKTQCKSEGQE